MYNVIYLPKITPNVRPATNEGTEPIVYNNHTKYMQLETEVNYMNKNIPALTNPNTPPAATHELYT